MRVHIQDRFLARPTIHFELYSSVRSPYNATTPNKVTQIIVGFGPCSGYTIPELPDKVLEELCARYPLAWRNYDAGDSHSMLVAIALHEELKRRTSGATAKKRIPTLKEMATDIVKSGFRQLSKTHHPDRNGSDEAQRRLIDARDRLQELCAGLHESQMDAIFISESGLEIGDDDIPF